MPSCRGSGDLVLLCQTGPFLGAGPHPSWPTRLTLSPEYPRGQAIGRQYAGCRRGRAEVRKVGLFSSGLPGVLIGPFLGWRTLE